MLGPIAHNHPLKLIWNIIILATVLVFSFVITYKMVFHTFRADGLYYTLNFIFLLDLALGFVFKIKRGHQHAQTYPQIKKSYLKSWFTIDLLSFLPFELIPVAIYGDIPTDPTGVAIYLGLQALTLVKLVKAVRIFEELTEAFSLSQMEKSPKAIC